MSQSASVRWAPFYGPGFWSTRDFSHISRLLKRGRVGMSEQSGRQGEYVAGDRPEGGSPPPAPPLNPPSTPRAPLFREPWVYDLLKVGAGAALGAVMAYTAVKDGVATGRRGFEIGLENRAAIASERAARSEAISSIKLAMEKEFHRMKTSFGKSLSDAIKPLVKAQEETGKAIAVMAKGQESFEDQIRNALDRIRTSRSTP